MLVSLAGGSEVFVCRRLPANKKIFYLCVLCASVVNRKDKNEERCDGSKTQSENEYA